MLRLISLALAITIVLTVTLAFGLDLEASAPVPTGLVLALFALGAFLLVSSALTAVAGLWGRDPDLPEQDPSGRTAVLWLVCGEDPAPIAARVGAFLNALDQTGQGASCDVFILSDTRSDAGRLAETRAFAPFGARVRLRHRDVPTDRKPGNLAEWLLGIGQGYETFLLLDADSGFSADRLLQMRRQMAGNPRLGLLQAGIRLRVADSRLGEMQRLSARLAGPVFARGLARLSGMTGNFWGHNALIRVAAFTQITPLPHLPGRAPWGGPILSHDFVEAAFLRRAGWQVAISPDSRGSFEDAPETVASFLRRDRRWAQGNLQHLRLLAAPGLHPLSRLHMGLGVMAYLMAPVWLALVLLTGSSAVHATAFSLWALGAVLALLLLPKIIGLLGRKRVWRSARRRSVLMRAMWAELAITTLFAPLAMVQRTGFVLAVLAGRSTDWVPSGLPVLQAKVPGRGEQLAGLAILASVALPQWMIEGPELALVGGALVLPVSLPLLFAPLLWRWLDAPLRTARAQDAKSLPALRVAGAEAGRTIHRQLWADGIATPKAASAHVNDLIAEAAAQALGRAPMRVIDMGCGAGGSLLHLARLWPLMQGRGITLSAEQVNIALARAQEQGVADRVQILRADFTQPTTLPQAELVLAVESHVHAPSADVFLRAAWRLLEPGGVLVIVDDMLAQPADGLDAVAAARLLGFQRGWRLGHVPNQTGLVALAQSIGFAPEGAQDLTPLLRLDRWRDQALRVAGPVADGLGLGRWPLFGNMIGGNALSQSYRAGTMRYTLIVLRKAAATRSIPEQAVA